MEQRYRNISEVITRETWDKLYEKATLGAAHTYLGMVITDPDGDVVFPIHYKTDVAPQPFDITILENTGLIDVDINDWDEITVGPNTRRVTPEWYERDITLHGLKKEQKQ